MKKIVLTLAALAIGMSSLFAWTNIPILGITGTIPTFITPADSELDTIKTNGVGLNLGYIGYFDFGLAFKDTTALGFGTAKSNYFDSLNSPFYGPFGIDFSEIIGVGYGVIRTDNLFLGVFGNIGVSTEIAVAAKKTNEYKTGKVIVAESLLLGTDVTAVYTPSKVFSLFASVSVNAAFGGVETASAVVYEGKDLKSHDEEWYSANPYLKVLPTIGIAWKF